MLDPDRHIRHINTALIVLITLMLAYLVVAPFAPRFTYWADKYTGTQEHLNRTFSEPLLSGSTSQTEDRLVIPAMLLETPIVETSSARAGLNKGAWHWPASSTPDKGGNTVILGRRFTYAHPKGVFYFLDKLQPGDRISLTWDTKRYIYKVVDIHILKPSDSSPTAPTSKPTLTLYSSTPLWLPQSSRLVVSSILESAL